MHLRAAAVPRNICYREEARPSTLGHKPINRINRTLDYATEQRPPTLRSATGFTRTARTVDDYAPNPNIEIGTS